MEDKEAQKVTKSYNKSRNWKEILVIDSGSPKEVVKDLLRVVTQ
jgi:hypothetical protein|tara:strand:- start:1879 stop:2010 length:132 start_codon:yes stop_codon:yes gene_type:complete